MREEQSVRGKIAEVRESGFYWGKKHATTTWRVNEWSALSKCWFVPGFKTRFADSEFAEIDERRIVRAA